MPVLELKSVSKSYGARPAPARRVLKNVSLKRRGGRVRRHRRLLRLRQDHADRLIAGLHAPDSGEVLFKGKPSQRAGPGSRRGVPELFADAVADRCATTSRSRSTSVFKTAGKAERNARVEQYIDMVGLSHASERKAAPNCPAACASAWRWRARWRWLPEMLLLDEPLSRAGRAHPRQAAGRDRGASGAQEKKTVVLITNDVDEGDHAGRPHHPAQPRPGRDARPGVPRSPFAAAARPRGDQPSAAVTRSSARDDHAISDGGRRGYATPHADDKIVTPAQCRARSRSITGRRAPTAHAADTPRRPALRRVFRGVARSIRRARGRSRSSTASTSRCARASSSRSSAIPAAASPPCCR